jgi:iron complex transport system ATP-binding protein
VDLPAVGVVNRRHLTVVRSREAERRSGPTAATGADLEVVGLTVTYDGTPVVDGVSLEVPAGSWLAVIGPNGAGKSSLLRAIAGLVRSTGRIRVGSRDLHGSRPSARARCIAYVPQSPTLPVGMTVAEYLLLGRSAHLGYLASESDDDRDRVRTVLDDLDLAHLAARDVTTLSGGESQRATLGRALAQDAPVILLDEPTSALDLGHQVRVLELVDRLRRELGITVVSAMHDLTLAGQFADRLVLLAGGRARATGPASAVLTEAALAPHYGARVRIVDDGEGGRIVVPLRSSAP